MTLGERIAALRKEKGFSQETLGEQIGVTRQAVSKWEADRAVPDVNNCVAISRALEVSLYRLLDVQEDTGAAADTAATGAGETAEPELADYHIKLLEQLAERYADTKRREQRRRWRWPIILAACAVMVGAAWLWEWLDDMNRTIEALSGEMAGLQGEIVSGIGDEVKQSLEAESSLITDYAITIAEADLLENTLTYEVTVNLKAGSGDTKVAFSGRAGGEIYTALAEKTAGLRYTGEVTCPITNDTAIYLEVDEAGETRSQLLEWLDYSGDYSLQPEGWITWAALEQSGLTEGAIEPVEIMLFLYDAPALSKVPEPTRLEVVQFRNDQQMAKTEVDLALGRKGNDVWTIHTQLEINVERSGVQAGDTLTFAAMAEDNYGRTASRILSRYRVLEEGKLEYLAEEMINLDDGAYGTEVWQ